MGPATDPVEGEIVGIGPGPDGALLGLLDAVLPALAGRPGNGLVLRIERQAQLAACRWFLASQEVDW